MKLQFKEQRFQIEAVDSVVNIFQGQINNSVDNINVYPDENTLNLEFTSYKNAEIRLDAETIKDNLNKIQEKNNLAVTKKLSLSKYDNKNSYNFTVEMETGTGKTYTYIRTIMELNKKYGWLKFVIVVPSVAIREGVLKSLDIMGSHFQDIYGKKPRFFVYDSSRLNNLRHFTDASDVQIMVINSQAFNGSEARKINSTDIEMFKGRKPIDLIADTRPILIIDEPQSVEGKKTKESLENFKPLFILRYSATHKEKYDMVYRLDAMDAYNKKLVKQIAVKSIEQSSSTGTDGYLYLQELVPQISKGLMARIEFDRLTKSGIKRVTKLVSEPFDLYEESGRLEAYRENYKLTHFDARDGENSIQVGAIRKLYVGDVIGNVNEIDLRKLQIKETIASHLEKEKFLFSKGIKVLSLFFIDEVAKYKVYDEDSNAGNGIYAEYFEEEYARQIAEYIGNGGAYADYLKTSLASQVHAGYFSIDKVKKSDKTIFVDYKSANEKKNKESNDKDAYDLIMKDKERLLSFEEPVRFIFSHSALKEGWDNPNVFQICTLKDSSAETRKRQEIGRGMRLAVDRYGIRQDEELLGSAVHEINKLTVIANESYDSFSKSLQSEIKELLSDRTQVITNELFIGKKITNESGESRIIDNNLALELYVELRRKGYIDKVGNILEEYHTDLENNSLNFGEDFVGYEMAISQIIDPISKGLHYKIVDDNKVGIRFSDHVNQKNLVAKEFKKLWERIHYKSSYRVDFDDDELVEKASKEITDKLSVSTVRYKIIEAEAEKMSTQKGLDLEIRENGARYETSSGDHFSHNQIKYDLIGEIADATELTRRTVAKILQEISEEKFGLFKRNPEEFITEVSRLINEQKASRIVDCIQYNILDETYDLDIFTDNYETAKKDANLLESSKGIYNYVKVDSNVEKDFKEELEQFEDVKVYAKLPSGFKIPTPLGNYNPDWAIAFREGSVKYVYFVAETKGSISSQQLKATEYNKIECAKAHFRKLREIGKIEDGEIYGVVNSYQELLNIVGKNSVYF